MSIGKLFARPIAFHRPLVDLTGGILPALMLSQAIYWAPRTKDQDGWFWKTREQWQDETGMSRREQETARKKLRAATVDGDPIWFEELRGMPGKLHYRINEEALTVWASGMLGASVPTRMAHPYQQEGTDRANNSIYTETTTETTTEREGNEGKGLNAEQTTPTTHPQQNPRIVTDDLPTPQPPPTPPGQTHTEDGHKINRKRKILADYDPRKFVDGYTPVGKGATPYEVYRESFNRQLKKPARSLLSEQITDLEKWRAICAEYMLISDYGNVKNLLDIYQNGWRQNGGNGNGNVQARTGGRLIDQAKPDASGRNKPHNGELTKPADCPDEIWRRMRGKWRTDYVSGDAAERQDIRETVAELTGVSAV